MSLLINGVSLITVDEEKDFIEEASLGIRNGIIDYIGEYKEGIEAKYSRTINYKNRLAMPGFINAHNHSAMTMFRNYADDMDLMDWLFNRIFPLEDKLTEEAAYYASSLAILEMIRAGVTTFCDMYMFMDRTAEAVIQSGMRAALGRGLQGEDGGEDDYRLRENLELYKKYHGTHKGRLKVNLAPHSIYTCSIDYLEKIKRVAEQMNLAVQIHLSETKDEVNDCMKKYGVSPIKLLDKIGLLNDKTVAAHCVVIDDEDLGILKDRQVNIVHNPSSNMKLGSGIAPVKLMLDKGINVALGTDGASSNNNQDILKEMRTASYLQKVYLEDSAALPVDEIIQMATINGAKALGFEDQGKLKEGMVGDIIIFNIDKPHYYPRYNLKSAVVYSGNSSDVETVIVDGHIIMENREILTMDEEKILFKVQKASKGL